MMERQGAYYTGTYRNLLAEYGYGEEAIQRRLDETWKQLFEGDEETRIYYPSGEDMGYMLDTGNLDVRTEGMSYGMMMAVQYDRQDVFDRLWKWAKTYMYLTEGDNAGYFAWSCAPDGKRLSNGPAPDGEEYFHWRCCSRPIAGATGSRHSTTAPRLGTYCAPACIRGKTEQVIRCGIRTTS